MKRILLHILLVANLFSGVALAWDSHPEALVGHEPLQFDQPVLQSHAAEHGHATGAEWEHAHHCCHGAAHLIGFIHHVPAPPLVAGIRPPLSPATPLHSLALAPHLRPPIL